MSFLIIDRERYALQIGDTVLGGPGDEVLALSPLAPLPPFAVLSCSAEGAGTLRRLDPHADLSVDGAPLGVDPTPLRHGARIAVGALQLSYGEMRTAGGTAHVSQISGEALTPPLSGLLLPVEGTAATGGRLVRAHGGTITVVPDDGLEIGRDPSCGLVLAAKSVSRRHALIAPTVLGYRITDLSSNGLLVNGARVDGTQLLLQGDVVRVGGEELRFEADRASYEPVGVAAPSDESDAVAGGAPAPPAATRRPPMPLLATLEVTTRGVLDGQRFRILRPVAQIGRAEGSDVHLPDESVSGAHATLLQRDGAWHVLDLGSRNGTYVDGERVTECRLRGACELRVGSVKLVFRPLAAPPSTSGSEQRGTREIVRSADG